VVKRVEIQVTCDRVAPGHGGEVESLEISLGGISYEIDLCTKHRKPYVDLLEVVTVDGRHASATRRQPAARRQPGRTNRSSEIRAWAKSQSIEVSARGRIADALAQRFDAR
jgi:Lsr2